jgi:hypothetical protein
MMLDLLEQRLAEARQLHAMTKAECLSYLASVRQTSRPVDWLGTYKAINADNNAALKLVAYAFMALVAFIEPNNIVKTSAGDMCISSKEFGAFESGCSQ